MIIKNDQTLVIPTPTKTATFSLESGFRSNGDYTIIKPRHRHTFPAYMGNVRPVVAMLIRHPYARIFSAWRWMKEHGGYALGRAETFEEFCEDWVTAAKARLKHDWTFRYTDYYQYYRRALGLRKIRIFCLEQDGVQRLQEFCGVTVEPRHVNASSKHLPKDERPRWEDHFTHRCRELVRRYLKPDLKLGGYDDV